MRQSQHVPDVMHTMNTDRLSVSYMVSPLCLGFIVHDMWDARDARCPKIQWVTIQSNTQERQNWLAGNCAEILSKENSKMKNAT